MVTRTVTRMVHARAQSLPLRSPFAIARAEASSAVRVVVVTVREGDLVGRAEAEDLSATEPVEALLDGLARAAPLVEAGADRMDLAGSLAPGSARALLDCALLDLEAQQQRRPVHTVLGLPAPSPVRTLFTVPLAAPEQMAAEAAAARGFPALKLKLGRADGDAARLAAVREARPDARLTVDANTGWTLDALHTLMPTLVAAEVAFIEQPLPPQEDAALAGYDSPIPLVADESCTDRASLCGLCERYAAINIKVDKAGGLTEAVQLAAEAKAQGLSVMVGCNLGSSLSLAPAFLLASGAVERDLDAALLLARDRAGGVRHEDGLLHPPSQTLWGGPGERLPLEDEATL